MCVVCVCVCVCVWCDEIVARVLCNLITLGVSHYAIASLVACCVQGVVMLLINIYILYILYRYIKYYICICFDSLLCGY